MKKTLLTVLIVAASGCVLYATYLFGYCHGASTEYAKIDDRCNLVIASNVGAAHLMLKAALEVLDGERDVQEFQKIHVPGFLNAEDLRQSSEAWFWQHSGGKAILAAMKNCQNADDRARLRQTLADILSFIDSRKKPLAKAKADLERLYPNALSGPQQ